jgi:hypothetical protein
MIIHGYPGYIFQEFSEKLGKTLKPIRLADNGHIAIVKDEKGLIYVVDGNTLFYLSNNLDEANKILNKDKLPELKKITELD